MKRDRRTLEGRPSLSSELIDLPPIRASAKMPKELAQLVSAHAQPRAARPRPVERMQEETAIATLDAHRPAWWDASMRPAPAKLTRPRGLRHAGREVDPLWIWPEDDRRIYNDPTHYPWLCVCRVSSGASVGSGVLIGPRHVLTASHIIDWNHPAVHVEVHRFGTSRLAESRSTDLFFYTKIDKNEHDTVDEDYVVVVVEERLGDAFGWMGCRTYDSKWDDDPYWFNIGYPLDVGSGIVPSWQRDKKLDEDELDAGGGRAMTTSADLMKGNSGGPMFGFWADGMPYVVAVASAEGDGLFAGRENYCAGGNDLTRLVHHARKTLP